MSADKRGPTPGPWHWAKLYDDGSGPDVLLGPNGETVLAPFLYWSAADGEGLDDWGLEVNPADLPSIAAAPGLLAALKAMCSDGEWITVEGKMRWCVSPDALECGAVAWTKAEPRTPDKGENDA